MTSLLFWRIPLPFQANLRLFFINDYEGFSSSFLSGSTSFATAETDLPIDLETLYEQASPDPQDLGEDFDRICSELYRLFYLSPDRDLPPSWPIRDFTLFILGDVDITPAYLADVYNNLHECGIDSVYWKMALDYLNLINGSYIYFDPMDLMSILSRKIYEC